VGKNGQTPLTHIATLRPQAGYPLKRWIAQLETSCQDSRVVGTVGRTTQAFVSQLGDFALFVAASFRGITGSRLLFRRVVRAIYEQGALCLPVILIVGTFTGLVLGLQGYHVLNRFGSEGLLGALVSLSLVREMAPVLAALMLVGQAGSALAAELGIQRNSEQIVALETMGIDSHGYLVAPRLLAALFVFPLQTALFVAVGLFGGSLSGSVLLGVDSGVYWSAVERAVEASDVRECIIKAASFGLLTISICAYHGFNAHRCSSATGARAVSASTTRAVVQSSIAVLAVDYAITSFFVR
jgi:phospholipid/cholesterol/gamma-HCH transport system permease protein